MGLRPALAKTQKAILRVPKAPKIPGPVVNAASSAGHLVVRAADAVRIPAAAAAVTSTAQTVTTTVQEALTSTARSPAFGVAMIACLIYASVDGAGAPPFPLTKSTLRDAAITPVAAVARASTDPTGPLVIAVEHPKIGFHIAAATSSAPPPTGVVNTPGALGIPGMALNAYRNAERMMATADPGCGISWNLLAGIGRIESGHADGGATDARGTAIRPIYGPTLDGTLPGNEVVVQSTSAGRVGYARAMGPMQFLPGTWARYASDGDGDGVADPQNLYDATLAAARYLCSGGLNLRDQSQVLSSILRYNNSMPYAQNVLGWAAAYATGVVPVDLPPLTGPRAAAGRRALGERRRPRAEPADEHARLAVDRPAGPDAADRPQRGFKQWPAAVVDAAAGSLVHGNLHQRRYQRASAGVQCAPDPGGHATRPVRGATRPVWCATRPVRCATRPVRCATRPAAGHSARGPAATGRPACAGAPARCSAGCRAACSHRAGWTTRRPAVGSPRLTGPSRPASSPHSSPMVRLLHGPSRPASSPHYTR